MSNKYLLDASSLLALLQGERSSEIVAQHIPFSAVSAVNLAEAASAFNNTGMPENEIHELFNEMNLEILPYEKEMAIATGGIRNLTRKKSMSLGDRACLVTTRHFKRIALTADGMWLDFQAEIGVEIELIR